MNTKVSFLKKLGTGLLIISILVVLYFILVVSNSIFQLYLKYDNPQQDLEYISNQVGSIQDSDAARQALVNHFQPGMTRKEVYDIIVEIDPSLEGHLPAEGYSGFTCDKYDCAEIIHFFENRAGNFGVIFHYDLDEVLERVSLISY